MNEDLGPVVDQMREAHGNEVSANFGGMMSTQLQSVIDELRVSKDKIDDAVDSIANGSIPANDMDMGDDDLGMGDELDMGMEDDLEIEEPLGRAAKESKEANLRNKIRVMEKALAAVKA